MSSEPVRAAFSVGRDLYVKCPKCDGLCDIPVEAPGAPGGYVLVPCGLDGCGGNGFVRYDRAKHGEVNMRSNDER
jgi:hypothetical protein